MAESSPSLWTRVSSAVSILGELTKIRLVSLVLMSAAVGYFLALERSFDTVHFLHAMISTALVASGSLALNQWMERALDAKMTRTSGRPLPSGRMTPAQALAAGVFLSTCGLVYMASVINLLSAALAAATLFSYLLLYTPLKRVTSLNTIAGAVPGAIPPMIGWAAASGKISYEAWVLFAIMFLWQLPHFLAIAWLYREDYKKAGFVMLSMNDPDGTTVGLQAVIASALLIPVSLLPTIFGVTGIAYFIAAIVLGLFLTGASLASLKNIEKKAKMLFAASIMYLFILLLMMIIDRN